jgi:hypothetical protein
VLINNIALISEQNPEVLVRAVCVDFEASNKGKRGGHKGKHTVHLSVMAALDGNKYVENLKSTDFPYKVDFGHWYVIRRATNEEVLRLRQKYVDTSTKILKEIMTTGEELRKKAEQSVAGK